MKPFCGHVTRKPLNHLLGYTAFCKKKNKKLKNIAEFTKISSFKTKKLEHPYFSPTHVETPGKFVLSDKKSLIPITHFNSSSFSFQSLLLSLSLSNYRRCSRASVRSALTVTLFGSFEKYL